MNWLARLRVPYDVVAIKGFYDGYKWHQALWDAFPGMAKEKRKSLTRIEKKEWEYLVYILSEDEPIRPEWCPEESWALKEIASSFLNHEFYRFDLIANPTKSVKKIGKDGKPTKNGTRLALFRPEEQRMWIVRKGNEGGFTILNETSLEIGKAQRMSFHQKGSEGCHYSVNFRGVLKVTDPKKFNKTFQKGIGTAKAFGFGMLLLQPINI